MYRTDFWTLWEKARVGCFKGTTPKHVCYLGWNRSPDQVGCMRQALGAGALGRPRGIGWRGRWEEGLGWGTHVYPWLIHVNVWQKPLQYCKVISLQLIKKFKKKLKILKKRKKKEVLTFKEISDNLIFPCNRRIFLEWVIIICSYIAVQSLTWKIQIYHDLYFVN